MVRPAKRLSVLVPVVALVLSVLTAGAVADSAAHRIAGQLDLGEPPAWKSGAIVRDAAGKIVLDASRRAPPGSAAGVRGLPSGSLPLSSGCPIGGVQAAGFKVPGHVDGIVRKLAPALGLDPQLVFAVIKVESNFHAGAVSPKKAQGLMQLIPETAKRFGVGDPFDPAQNIRGGMTYLRWLLDEFNGNLDLALAGYNAGEKAVERHKGIPPYRETRNYVRKVLAHYGCGTGRGRSAFGETVTEGPRRGWHALGGESWEPVREPYDLWNAARRSVGTLESCGGNGRRGWSPFDPEDSTTRCQ